MTPPPRPKIVYFGTPAFAVPALEALEHSQAYDIKAVVTQPDKPAGRGQKLHAPAVKQAAERLGIDVFQPVSIKNIELLQNESTESPRLRGEKSSKELAEFLNSLGVIDAFICVAYGKIVPSSLLAFPKAGMVNIHPSLLPRWRGAAPLQYAIFSGDKTTGVSLMQIDEGLDSGPVYAVEELPIAEDDTLGTLHDKLAALGAQMLLKHLPAIISGELLPRPQAEEGLTYAEKWERSDAEINWNENAETIVRRIRASSPIPGGRTKLGDEALKIYYAHQVEDQNFGSAAPGTIVESNAQELIIACGNSQFVAIDELQYPGKNRLNIETAQRGRPLPVGLVLGE